MDTSIVAFEENAVSLPQTQPVGIAVNEATAPTVIGDRTQVHYHNTVNTTTIVTTAKSDIYEEPITSQVQEKIDDLQNEKPLQTSNHVQIPEKKSCQGQDATCGSNEPFVVPNGLDRNESDENSEFNKVDQSIEKYPNTPTTLLNDLIENIRQTNDNFERKEWIKRVNVILDRISDAEDFKENSCGIYGAEEILRQFFTNPQKVLQFISIYAAIFSVMLKNCAPPRLDKALLKPFLTYLRGLVRPPQFYACTRVRRDIKVVVEMLTRSTNNPKMLEDAVEFIRKIQTFKDNDNVEVLGECKKCLEKNSWFQHFLIITWLKMEVLRKKKRSILSALLQVISYIASKWQARRQRCRWKLTLTIVESLTNIATMVPDLSKIAIAGDADGSLQGLIHFFEILSNQKCKEIFYQHARLLVYIEDTELRHLLLTGIFRELDVSSEEIVKDRVKRSQPLRYLAISETLHNGENAMVISGHFKESQVVAKCYKVSRKQLIAKNPSEVSENSRYTNELSILSYLRKKKLHSNIVHLIASDEELPCLVLKRVSQRSLLKFLRHRRTKFLASKLPEQLHMIIQISDAQVFLEKEKIIHLGIRAENVLVDENLHVNLTGFQSSCKREAAVHKKTIENKHVKWMDPEGLSTQPVSHATDVWSLGVFMYEMFTYGCVPYNNPRNNVNHGDFERKPMTASQAKVFVLRGGKLPKHPCIPESLFELMNEKCFQLRPKRAKVAELRDFLQEQLSKIEEEMLSFQNPRQTATPPELRFLKEDVGPEDYNPGAVKIEDQDEDFPFVHLSVVDLVWNEEFSSVGDLNNEDSYTNADPEDNEPVLCSTGEHYKESYPTNHVVLEYKEFRHIKHAEKLKTLNHPSLVKILAINRFGPNKLEMVSESFPLGNVLSALLSSPNLRQHLVLYMTQIASAVIYLHDQGIVHGCLRGENILLESEKQVKLGRLGFSKKAQDVNADYIDMDQLLHFSSIADARWNPTEIAKTGLCSKESEYWSFGIVCWELSQAANSPTGTTKESILPYKNVKDDEVYSLIKLGSRLPNPDPSSTTLYNIYKDFWKREPNERLSILCGCEKLRCASIVRVNHLDEEASEYQQAHNGLADVENNNKAVSKLQNKSCTPVQENRKEVKITCGKHSKKKLDCIRKRRAQKGSERNEHNGIKDCSLKSNQDSENLDEETYDIVLSFEEKPQVPFTLLEDSQSMKDFAQEGGETKEHEERAGNTNSDSEESNVQDEGVSDNLKSDSLEGEEVYYEYGHVSEHLRTGREDDIYENDAWVESTDSGSEKANSQYENMQDNLCQELEQNYINVNASGMDLTET